MDQYECEVCHFVYDEESEGTPWHDLSTEWKCPVCAIDKGSYHLVGDTDQAVPDRTTGLGPTFAGETPAHIEQHMVDISWMAEHGTSVLEPMRTSTSVISWDDILILGAQLAKIPLNKEETVNTRTVIGPNAGKPLVIETPVYVTHMSFGALSRSAKVALAKGSAAVQTAMCSGEGGILEDSFESSYKYIFEYVPNEYSVTDENLCKVDAIEIKFGQSTKPGMGGHLPGGKVTEEIGHIRGFPPGTDIISPSHFRDIRNPDELKRKVEWLREASGGRPIGVKLAAGHIEADLEVALHAKPDFITIDGRPGATGASPKLVKAATSVPTIYALHRARKHLDSTGNSHVSLVITGGLRVSSDFAKAISMGADAVAIGTAALIACGCRQFRICGTGMCPAGITTHDPELTQRLDVDAAAQRLENFLRVSTEELKEFARLTGNSDIHRLSNADLVTTSSEISNNTDIGHA